MAAENLIIERYLLAIDVYFEKSEYFEGRKLLEEALFVDPLNGLLHSYLGWYYYTQLSDFNRADRHYKLALEANYTHPGVYLNYANVLRQLHKYEEAIALCERGLSAAGVEGAMMYYEMAFTYELLGKFKVAQKAAESGLKIVQNDELGRALDQTRRRAKSKLLRFATWQVLTL